MADNPACRFFGGNLIWRGHFNASGKETAFNLTVQGGLVFGYAAYLNGNFLGSNSGSTTASLSADVWKIPNGTLRVGEDNVLTVLQGMPSLLVRSSDHPDDLPLFSDHMGIVETSSK